MSIVPGQSYFLNIYFSITNVLKFICISPLNINDAPIFFWKFLYNFAFKTIFVSSSLLHFKIIMINSHVSYKLGNSTK